MFLKVINKSLVVIFRGVAAAAAGWAAFCAVCFGAGSAAYGAFQPDLSIKVASEGDAGYLAPGLYEQSALVQVKSQGAAQGVAAVYRVLVRNAGDSADTVRITGAGSGNGYAVQYLDQGGADRSAEVAGGGMSAALAAGASTVLTVRVTPAGAPQVANFEAPVHAVSLGDPSKADEVKSATCNVGSVAAVTLSSPPDRTGIPGSLAVYPYTVTNAGNTANAFTLHAAGAWQGVLYADDGAGGGVAGDGVRQPGETNLAASTGVLEPGDSYRLLLEVAIPATAPNSAHSDQVVTVAGTGAAVSDRVTTGVIAPALSLVDSVRNLTRGGVFASAVEAAPGDTLEYRLAVTSSGSLPATDLVLRNELPANTSFVAGSLMVSNSPSGTARCAPASCGEASEAAGEIVARLGEGASGSAGGTLPVGRTLYLFFRVQVL